MRRHAAAAASLASTPHTVKGEKARVAWSIPRPMHDLYLVAIASGPGVEHPFWPVGKPYQPTSRVWAPRLLAATNPVWIDADGDGKGEYGTFLEMSGAVGVRKGFVPGSPSASNFSVKGEVLSPPVLSSVFANLTPVGYCTKSGYAYMVLLPDTAVPASYVHETGGAGVPPGFAGGTGSVGVDASEVAWCAYAQPMAIGSTGTRRFFTNQRDARSAIVRASSRIDACVAAVRARFSALARPLVFFDAPGGTQTPDEVIDAIAGYLRESNANSGGEFETSRRTDALTADARLAAAGFLGCSPGEVVFGANMTSLNFALTRAFARELRPGDEIVVTALDHDANVSPWLELARDLDLVVRFADLREEDCTLDLDDLARQLSARTRVVAFPWASNAVGTITPVARVAELAHEAGALAWVDAVHYAPHGPIDVAAAGVDVLVCSPYKFFGPHLGLLYGRREVLERWRPYKVRPSADEPVAHRFETGTLAHEALAGFTAAVEYVESIGWEA